MKLYNENDKSVLGYSVFLHRLFLNELVTGQKQEFIYRSLKKYNDKLNINFKNYYILLTGIKKEIYFNKYNIDAAEYLKVFNKVEKVISKYMYDNNYIFEIFMYYYFNTKQMCIIFNRGEHSDLEVEVLSEFINETIQIIYEQEIFNGDKSYFNFTTLSPLLYNYEHLKPAFDSLQELGRLSFFHKEHMVMTEKKLYDFKKEFTYTKANQLLTEVIDSITMGRVALCEELIKKLFLESMRYGYDITLCWDIMTELKKQVYHINIIFDLHLDEEIENNFKLNIYPNIYEMYETVNYILKICVNEANKKGKGICYITQQAIKYIREYYNKDISLSCIADYVKVVPTYLSEIFNKEMKMSIIQYLTTIRIEKSKILLIESNLKIYEVAKSVGISDSNYFSKVFKKYEGVSPHEFKEMNK